MHLQIIFSLGMFCLLYENSQSQIAVFVNCLCQFISAKILDGLLSARYRGYKKKMWNATHFLSSFGVAEDTAT